MANIAINVHTLSHNSKISVSKSVYFPHEANTLNSVKTHKIILEIYNLFNIKEVTLQYFAHIFRLVN